MPTLSMATATLMLILPWPLLLTGVIGTRGSNSHFRLMRELTTKSAWFALVSAILAVIAYLSRSNVSETFLSVPLPWGLNRFALSVDVNSLTVLMTLLVTLVGLVVSRYAFTYMDGDPHEGAFHRWLSLTLGSFLMMITTGNLWEFFIFWVATSLFLHNLLAFYRDRPLAVLAARKKYLFHRIADVSLFIALVLVVRTLHTTEFDRLLPAVAGIQGNLPVTLQAAAGLFLLSAVLKSAQVPFHGWLIQVMEAPTPVSALLHAGIIYTGTFLLLRMTPIMSRVPWSGDLLIVIGLGSVTAASLMMMTATNIKGSLAYSTCAQMGFMLLELGLGVYALALLHIVSHAVYKAHAFLSSGSIVDHSRWPAIPAATAALSTTKTVGSWFAGAVVVILTGWILQVPLLRDLPITVMGIILAIALSQLIWQTFIKEESGIKAFMWSIGLSALLAALYFLLDALFTVLFGTVLPVPVVSGGITHDLLLGLTVAAFVSLLWIQQRLPRLLEHPLWQAVFVHLYNDLYFDMMISRWIRKWTATAHPQSLPNSREPEHQLRKVISS